MAIVPSLDKLSKPGDIVIKDITIMTPAGAYAPLWNLIMSVEIYEDMYSNSLSGTLVFTDSMALVNHLPITGNEKLRISFYTPGQENQSHEEITLYMVVYKVTRSNVTDKSMVTVLDFISEEFFRNSMIKFSGSYKNMSYSQMAKEIFDEYIKNPVIDSVLTQSSDLSITPYSNLDILTHETEGNDKTIVFPWWSPFYAINWLANKSYGTISGDRPVGYKNEGKYTRPDNKKVADYVFFQQLDGSYQFAPISWFKTGGAAAEYSYVPHDKKNDLKMMNNIEELTILNFNDKLQDVSTGVYSSSIMTFDITTKRTGGDFFNYSKEFSETEHTDNYPLIANTSSFNQNFLSYLKILPKNSYKHDGVQDNEEHERYALLRQSQMNQLNCITIQVRVKGDSRRRVGDLIKLNIPSPEAINGKGRGKDGDGYDKYLAGYYLITKINHSFSHNDYELIMTLHKDSYRSQLPDEKISDSEAASAGTLKEYTRVPFVTESGNIATPID